MPTHMTRRRFVSLTAPLGALSTLASCAGTDEADTATTAEQDTGGAPAEAGTDAPEGGPAPAVYFVRTVDPDSLVAVFDALGRSLTGKIGVKLSSGEPGGNHYLHPELIAKLVEAVDGTIVECNTAYDGRRYDTKDHYEVAEEHGFTSIADFQIMDEDGGMELPVEGGFHLTQNQVGAHFADYDGFLILSHFKGHMMAGFGGALKNVSIGMASTAGKFRIHTSGASDTEWVNEVTSLFEESMADACQAVLAARGDNMLYVNVMNNLSVDCDCDPNPAPPKMADIGILASADPVALDQACVDLVYASNDDSADLIARIESLDGQHVLEAAEQLGVGSRAYELVEIEA